MAKSSKTTRKNASKNSSCATGHPNTLKYDKKGKI